MHISGASAFKNGLFAMAIRHEIQNLTRRGNVYYWRPRVPVAFSGGGIAGHLSLSLKQSDRDRAAYIARKLNTLLHDLKLRSTSRMTTKDQLAALFKAEIDRMHEWMEDLHLASRRFGRQDDIENLEADMEVGWAYRLLQLFGLRRQLSFEDGCPARDLLERAGIPDPHIGNIAATFRSEQRGLSGAGFGKQLADHMVEFGIADTLANRERALIEIFRAKADVLLDVEGRYPFTDPELSALTRKAKAKAPENDPPPGVAPQPAVSPVPANPAVPAAPAPLQPEIPTEGQPADHPQPPAENADAAIQSGVRDAMPASATIRSLPLGGFMEECENLISNNNDNWAADTAGDVRVLVKMFVGILEEHGVSGSADIRQEHLAALRKHFNEIPTNYGRSSRQRLLSTKALRDLAAKLVEAAKDKSTEPPAIGLSTSTIRRHLGNLQHFLTHLEGAGYPLQPLTLKGVKPKKRKTANVRTLTDKPGPDRIRPVYDLPIFTGCMGERSADMAIPGDNVFHSSFYYVPMLYTYLGPRRAEVAGLAADDIVETENGWAIHMRYNEFRTLKNQQSVRLLPVPDELIRLNFIEYVHAIKALGHRALFPELHSPFYKVDTGDRFYKSFVPLMKADKRFNADLWERIFHALRHGFSDTMKQNGVEMAIIDDITGHSGRTEGEKRYTNAAGLPLIRQHLAKYPIITDHLKPLPIRLLSWVQAKEPAPWATSRRKQKVGAG